MHKILRGHASKIPTLAEKETTNDTGRLHFWIKSVLDSSTFFFSKMEKSLLFFMVLNVVHVL